MEFQNYNFVSKNRNNRGGGVGILIKKGLDYHEVNSFENFKREICAIKIKLKNTLINLIAW